MTYELDILIPTARFVFSVEGDAVEVLPEHRSPEAFVEYRALRDRRPVVGMTTFPNTVLLRGPRTILVDPGLPLQNDPVLRALEARGLSAGDVDLVVLTHAHLDHAGGCASVMAPVAVHELETASGLLAARRRAARAVPAGAARAATAGSWRPASSGRSRRATATGTSASPATRRGGRAVLCGDTIGPGRDEFDAMAPSGPAADALLASWRRIRAWDPALIVAGHLPPFAP